MSEPTDPDATMVVDRSGSPGPVMPEIPGYTMLKKLGEGGMAQVYLAQDDSLRREVAIKLMSAALSDEPGFADRFTLEGQIVAQFQHPHIAQVFSSGASGEQVYLVMAFVPGQSLADRLAQGPGEPDWVSAVGRQLAGALHYAHERDVIHRDLKPANILFTDNGEPVLCDFGIAKTNIFSDTEGMTATGVIIGSPRYMAPEQLRGEQITNKVDIYALGLVLYEMLSGQALPSQRRLANARDEAKVIAKDLPANARQLAPLIARCISQDPDARPTAKECENELAALSAPAPRNRWPLYLGLVLVAAFLGAGSMQYFGPQDAPVPELMEPQPNFAEYTSYHKAIEKVGEPHPPIVHFSVYKELLDLRDLMVEDPATFIERVENIKASAAAGDPRAGLVLFLAVDAKLTSHPQVELEGWLSAAARGGLPMASFYQALIYLSEIGRENMRRPNFLVLRGLLEQARRQGATTGDDLLRQITEELKATENAPLQTP